MIHLHHLQNSRSYRIVWLLEELKMVYKLTCYDRNNHNLAPKILEQIHPMGKAPILQVGAKTLAESAYIIEYLLRHNDMDNRFKPIDDVEWENYTFWMHFAESSAMPNLIMRLVFNKVVEKSPLGVRPISKGIQKSIEQSFISPNIDKMLLLMDEHLSNNKWFAGSDFSAADIQMHMVGVAANKKHNLDKSKYANILNWINRCESRSAFLLAEEKGCSLNFD